MSLRTLIPRPPSPIVSMQELSKILNRSVIAAKNKAKARGLLKYDKKLQFYFVERKDVESLKLDLRHSENRKK